MNADKLYTFTDLSYLTMSELKELLEGKRAKLYEIQKEKNAMIARILYLQEQYCNERECLKEQTK